MPNTRRQLFRSSAGFATLHPPSCLLAEGVDVDDVCSVRSNAKVTSLTCGLHCIPGHNELQFHWLIECEFVCVCASASVFVLRNWVVGLTVIGLWN